MNFAVVTRHVPDREGTAAGRILAATCEGLIAEGHSVRVLSWGTDRPTVALPGWSEWRPVAAPRGASRIRAYLEPVTEVRQTRWVPPDDADTVVVADDPPSWPAVAPARAGVVTFHYLTGIDLRALRRPTAQRVQEWRAERRAARQASVVLAYSDRVAAALGARAVSIPVAYPVPATPVEPVEEPVVALVADWRWPPNAVALRRLREVWPSVRAAVRGARLLLAGRGLGSFADADGMEAVGAPARSVDVLSRAAVVAFPSPATSGPKTKVLEALAYGLPVVTTAAGVEGLRIGAGAGAVVTDRDGFADALAALLSDPAERRRLGAAGRAAVLASHAPRAAASRRVEALRAAFGVTAPRHA